MSRFVLVHDMEPSLVCGLLTFHTIWKRDKVTFQLDKSLNHDYWNTIGMFKVDENGYKESNQLFLELNNRLPIEYKNETLRKKVSYIKRTKLKYSYDSFILYEI